MNRHEQSMQDILKRYPAKEQWRLSFQSYTRCFKDWDTWAAIGLMILWGKVGSWLLPMFGISSDDVKWASRIGMLPFVGWFAWVLTKNADKHLRMILTHRDPDT